MNSYLEENEEYAGVTPAAEVVQEQQEPVQEEQIAQEEPQISEKELNFRALREEIAREKQEREYERNRYNEELYQLKAKLHERQEPVKSEFDDLQDDDFITVAKYRRIQEQQKHQLREQEEAYRLKLSEMETRVKNPDYDEVMERYSIPLIKENKNFARAFQAAEDKAAFAYELGRMMRDAQVREEQPIQRQMSPQQKADRILQNASKPGTLSSARGGQPSLSKAEYYAKMSDAEFNKMVAENLDSV